MPTQVAEKTVTKNPENVMEFELALEFVRVVEEAAIASAHTMGTGDGHKADKSATEAMRKTMDSVPMRGTIVIGEGERDKAPMLYIGEPVGAGWKDSETLPEVDIAVDPLEGTNLCSTGAPGAIIAGARRRQFDRHRPRPRRRRRRTGFQRKARRSGFARRIADC